MPAKLGASIAPRPRRGDPAETRERIVRAAAEVFNRDGYEGTDSNRIARAAGYAPGTFYKHFDDKRAVFMAVYEDWVSREWREVSAILAAPDEPTTVARRIVTMFLAHHRRWRGFRASLRALVATDTTVRSFYRRQRRRQLDQLVQLRTQRATKGASERDALLLYSLERTADALADDEPQALGLDRARLEGLLVDLVRDHLGPPRGVPR